MICEQKKSKKLWTKKILIFLHQKHSQILFYFIVFLLLFLGGLRFNPLSSLVMALIDTIFVILFFKLFYFVIERNNPNSLKSKMLVFLEILLLLFLGIITLTLLGRTVFAIFFPEQILLKSTKLVYPLFKNSLLIMGSAIGALIQFSNDKFREMERLSIEKNKMELTLLRSQINPHFVFNALNNIYALIYKKNENASDAILKLAEMFRYITDECRAETITMEKELNYIQNYLSFQKMRIGNLDNLNFEYFIDNFSVKIPPMTLQPFIENAFIHGDIQYNPEGFINLSLSVRDNKLKFYIENSITPGYTNSIKEERVGVGIDNVNQRLKLTYKNHYSLNIQNSRNLYNVTLSVDLK